MELWIHKARIEGLRLWLSGMMRIQVSLVSLEQLNQQLSACGFALHKDPDKNFIFRVMYTGCFVQLRHGSYVMELNLLKRIHRFGGRSHNYVMKCPTVTSPPNREHIRCDPDFIQVTRQVPLDSWNKELQWSLALRGSLVVALEDASLIQVNVERSGSNISIQGRRREILRPVLVIETKGEFLPLKLVSGHYAYSMEATCPDVSSSIPEMTVLNIFKCRMGLTRRGGYENDTLSVSSVLVNQTDKFTWSENSDFVQLVIPTSAIQHNKSCMGEVGVDLLQHFFRVDAVLSFKETNHKMHWTMENTLPCMRSSGPLLVEQQHSSTSESPLPVFPTLSISTVDLHSNLPTPAQKMATSTISVTSTMHHSREPANSTAKPTERLNAKSSTTVNTRQPLADKQQTNTTVSKNTVPSSPLLVKSTSKRYTVGHTSAGIGQTLERSWTRSDGPQPTFSTVVDQTVQELSGSPLSKEQTNPLGTGQTTPAVSVKSDTTLTPSRTQSHNSENVLKTPWSRYKDQRSESSSSILLAFMKPVDQRGAKSTSTPQQTVTETITPGPGATSVTMNVSQPVTSSATQGLHQTVMSSGATTWSTTWSTDFPHTSPFHLSAGSHDSTQVAPYSVLTAEKSETFGVVSLTPASHGLETEPRTGIPIPASPHAPPGSLRGIITQLVPEVMATLDLSTTTPLYVPTKTLVPSHYPVTRGPNVRPIDTDEVLHSTPSIPTRNTPYFNTETEYGGIVGKETNTVPPVSLITTLDSRMGRSEMILKGLLYGNTGHVKDSGVLYTQQWTSPVKRQRSPPVHHTQRPALTTVFLSEDQNPDKTTRASRVIHTASVSKQVASSKAYHQSYVFKTNTMDPSQKQIAYAPAQTPTMAQNSQSLLVLKHSSTTAISEPQQFALYTPSQPRVKGTLSEAIVPTAPSIPATHVEISASTRASSMNPNLPPQSVTGNLTGDAEIATDQTSQTERPASHINISVSTSQSHH
ncbi:hypothetical protein ACEWY4_000415 [Coilia grayii]|uniref:Uncharacterized protein n=1 Tax=Coilia grayii TaxID=363190 RepID=A0ABD1KWM1_9TELE